MRVLLTTTTNSFEAKVIAAHLQAEGLDPELRGAVDGPYPFMVGGMAEVAVYVPEDQLDDARLVMLATEVDAAVGARVRAPTRWTRSHVMTAAAVLAVLLLVAVARVLQLA